MMSLPVRVFLFVLALGVTLKLVVAPRRRKWLTLFGNVSRDEQPRMFWFCMTVGVFIVIVAASALLFPRLWID